MKLLWCRHLIKKSVTIFSCIFCLYLFSIILMLFLLLPFVKCLIHLCICFGCRSDKQFLISSQNPSQNSLVSSFISGDLLFYTVFIALYKWVSDKSFLQRFIWSFFTLFRMGVCKKFPPPPTSFSPVPSTNVEISPQNFLTLIFNPFCHTVYASPKLLNFSQEHPSKKNFFWSNPYKFEVMTTSLIETPE